MLHEIRLTDEELRLVRKAIIKRKEDMKSEIDMINYICDEDDRDPDIYELDKISEYDTLKDIDNYLFHEALEK